MKKRPERIEAGDEVRVVTLGQKGHVVDIVSATEATVQLGIMKMKVELTNLEGIGSTHRKSQLIR